MPFIQIEKSRGPNTDPAKTPIFKGKSEAIFPYKQQIELYLKDMI